MKTYIICHYPVICLSLQSVTITIVKSSNSITATVRVDFPNTTNDNNSGNNNNNNSSSDRAGVSDSNIATTTANNMESNVHTSAATGNESMEHQWNTTPTNNKTVRTDGIPIFFVQDNETTGEEDGHHGEVWLRNFFSIYIEGPSTRLDESVYMWIRFTFLTVLIPAGVTGNLLTMVVMNRPSLRNHPMSGRFSTLAFCDLCCCLIRGILWLRLGFALAGQTGPINFDNDHWCRFSEYFFTAIHISESWIVVYITLERAIIVVLPIKGSSICRQSFTKFLLPFCLIGPFIETSYLPFITRYKPRIGCATKAFPDMYAHFITATTSVSMVPLTLIFLSNVSIIISLKRQDLKVAHSNRSARFRKVTNMVLAVSIAFLTAVFPQAANALMTINNPHWTWLRVTDDVTAILWDLNFAINFYLYVITGNQVRVELRKMFKGEKEEVAKGQNTVEKKANSNPPFSLSQTS